MDVLNLNWMHTNNDFEEKLFVSRYINSKDILSYAYIDEVIFFSINNMED